MNSGKQWLCKHGHVLGLISSNGAGVPQLMVYRHALDMAADVPAEVDVMIGPVMGQMPVRCDVDGCDDVQVWKVSVPVMLYLVEGMPTQLLFEFWNKLLLRAKTPSVLRTSPPNTPSEIFGGERAVSETNGGVK